MHTGSNRRGQRSLSALVLASLAAFVVLLAFPLTSLADLPLGSTVSGLVNGVTNTVQTTVQNVVAATSPVTGAGSGQTGTAAPSAPAGSPASAPALHRTVASVSRPTASAPAPAASSTGYTPPMYGTNPHGQGTVASAALNPSSNVPYSYSPGGSSNSGEILVLGRGRSEQNPDGSYHAHTTIVGLLGTELLGVDAPQGQSNTGPLNALQTGVLDQICSNTNELICLSVLAADTSAYQNGANTHFAVAQLSSQQIAGLNASAASSDSGISSNGTCQSSYGDSSVANVALASGPVAGVSQSGDSSNACAGQAPTQSANSSDISLGGNGVPLPAPGCANGTPNTAFSALSPLVGIYCNADDSSQAPAPAGVREALTVLGLQVGGTSLARVTTAASEAHAVAPSATTTSGGNGGGGGTGTGTGTGAGSGNGGGTGTTGNGGKSSGSGSGSGSGKGNGSGNGSGGNNGNGNGTPGSGKNCTDADHDCGIGPNGAPEACVAGVDPDGDGDCVIGANRFAGQITTAKSSSSLPFTGENVLEVILVGLILVGVGLTLSIRGKVPVPFRKRS